MENLAYIYVAQAYASSDRDLRKLPDKTLHIAQSAAVAPYMQCLRVSPAEETVPSPDGTGTGKFLAGLKLNRLSSLASICWLAVGLNLWILSFVPEAIAMTRGDRGTPVSCVQRVLSCAGYYHGPIDGVYGDETEAAVINYELDRAGKGDGRLKATTVAKMGCAPHPDEQLPRVVVLVPEPLPRPRVVVLVPEPLPRPRVVLLSVGSRSQSVTSLQVALRARGYFDGPVTGYYGPITKSAVMQFQQAYGLTVDGIAGPRTMAAMQGSVAPNLVAGRI